MRISNTSSTSNTIVFASCQLNIWFGIFLWIIGNLGCTGNSMVFCSRTFRKRAYSVYLFAATIIEYIFFNFVLLTRIIQNGFQYQVANRFVVICKLRQFCSVWCNVVAFSLFSMATIDRILSIQRANKYRQWSNRTSLAYGIAIFIPFFWFLLFVHRIILYDIENGTCLPLGGFYMHFDNYFQVIFSSISPVVIMSIMTYLLLKNVHQLQQRRLQPFASSTLSVVTSKSSIINQMEMQLTIMLTLESFIAVITYIPYAAELIYGNITQEMHKTDLRLAWEQLLTELIHLFSYLFFATSFYVSLLSNNGFRRTIKRMLNIQRNNNLVPAITSVGNRF